MTVGELKKLLNDVPDSYTVGYIKRDTICDNWFGTKHIEMFCDVNIDLTCNIKEKTLSLFTK